MNDAGTEVVRPGLRTPRSGAVAGIVFGIVLGTAYVLLRTSIPVDDGQDASWMTTRRTAISVALALIPIGGIAFLWFIGVVRDHIGTREDRFVSSVFFGSGLLFLAMTFASAAIAGGMLATYAVQPAGMVTSGLYSFSRDTMFRITNIYAVRMAGVFMISLGTLWRRTGAMPRPLTMVTYALALVLLVSISFSLWVVMIFPGWVVAVSLYILILSTRSPVAAADSTA
jgi:hypothetical protein